MKLETEAELGTLIPEDTIEIFLLKVLKCTWLLSEYTNRFKTNVAFMRKCIAKSCITIKYGCITD